MATHVRKELGKMKEGDKDGPGIAEGDTDYLIFVIQPRADLRITCRPSGRFWSSGCDCSDAPGDRKSPFSKSREKSGLYPAIGRLPRSQADREISLTNTPLSKRLGKQANTA
jgi:hypothetical protein